MGNSCCVATNTASLCPECEAKGISVGLKTLKHLLKEDVLRDIIEERAYSFCRNPDCEIVYFSGDSLFTKEKLKVRLGVKEKEPPIPICYCFNITREDILKVIKEKGRSTASERIKKEIKASGCDCDIKNPSGRCCLGDVMKVEKEIMTDNNRFTVSGFLAFY